MEGVNTTYLDIEKEVIQHNHLHRDYLAHLFRWAFVMKFVKIGHRILDVGCADGELAQFLYWNSWKPKEFVGVDINQNHLKKFSQRKLNFEPILLNLDIRKNRIPFQDDYFDIVTCFEVVEHFEKKYIDFPLTEMKRVLKQNGTVLLSTPNFDQIHKAKNHIYEYEESELEEILNRYFKIENKFGTFASQKDIVPELNKHEKEVFDMLKEYYYSHVLSIIFAPLHPSASRNILWVLKKRNGRYRKIMEYVNSQNQVKNLTEDEKNKVYDTLLSLDEDQFNIFYKEYILPNKSFL